MNWINEHFNKEHIKNYLKNINLTTKKILFGSIGGLANVILFNPIDRAMYKSVSNHTSLFLIDHWKHPFQGVSNAIFQRILSYGLYYPIYEIFENNTKKYVTNKKHYTFLSSIMTSCFIEFVTSPISAIKLTNWNTNHKKQLLSLGKKMYSEAGLYAFTRGTVVTVKRGLIWGGTFGFLSLNYNDEKLIQYDIIYCMFATLLSSYHNYVRCIIYKSPLDNTKKIKDINRELLEEIKIKCKDMNTLQKIKFVLNNKFCVGFGTFRVALGMSISRQIYIFLNNNY